MGCLVNLRCRNKHVITENLAENFGCKIKSDSKGAEEISINGDYQST